MGLAHPDELEYLGYSFVRAHPRYPSSHLYRRPVRMWSELDRPNATVHYGPSIEMLTRSPMDHDVGEEHDEEESR
jgi:hypothetical protein